MNDIYNKIDWKLWSEIKTTTTNVHFSSNALLIHTTINKFTVRKSQYWVHKVKDNCIWLLYKQNYCALDQYLQQFIVLFVLKRESWFICIISFKTENHNPKYLKLIGCFSRSWLSCLGPFGYLILDLLAILVRTFWLSCLGPFGYLV